MQEFWTFHDTWIVVTHNWFWMLVALALGVIVGWITGARETST